MDKRKTHAVWCGFCDPRERMWWGGGYARSPD